MAQGRYEPMLLTKAEPLPMGSEWVYEPKLDGYRIVAYRSLARVMLKTRHGNIFTDRFPTVAQQLPDILGDHEAVLDGEMVGFDEEGRHNLVALQRNTTRKVFFVFDLLELDGEPLIHKPWEYRRSVLEEVVEPQDNIEPVRYFDDRDALLVGAESLALEGIVAKRRQSRYQPGKRSQDWQKRRFVPHGRYWRTK